MTFLERFSVVVIPGLLLVCAWLVIEKPSKPIEVSQDMYLHCGTPDAGWTRVRMTGAP